MEGSVQLIKRSKKNLQIVNMITFDNVNLDNFHNNIIDIAKDSEFSELCKLQDSKGIIFYLEKKGILKLKLVTAKIFLIP